MEETLRAGEIIRTTRLAVHEGARRWSDVITTYGTKKGHRFVLVLLGCESDGQELDPDKALESMGWIKAPPKKGKK